MSITRKVTVVLTPDHEDGGFAAYVPSWGSVIGCGDTREAALAALKECLEAELEDRHPDHLWYLELAYMPEAELSEIEVDVPDDVAARKEEQKRSA